MTGDQYFTKAVSLQGEGVFVIWAEKEGLVCGAGMRLASQVERNRSLYRLVCRKRGRCPESSRSGRGCVEGSRQA